MPGGLTGSWAGAMGHTQFMPTVYQRHAVDFDGDGKRDIWTSAPDALASTANYLRAHGWRSGEGWGYEVVLPDGFDAARADETTSRSLAAWRDLGVKPAHDRPIADDSAQATLILPAGIRGPAFLLRPNFAVILRYNTALAYALTVALLSDRLRGDPGLSRDWPRGDRALTGDERRDLQTRLTERGYATGGVDGKIGPKTRAALRPIRDRRACRRTATPIRLCWSGSGRRPDQARKAGSSRASTRLTLSRCSRALSARPAASWAATCLTISSGTTFRVRPVLMASTCAWAARSR